MIPWMSARRHVYALSALMTLLMVVGAILVGSLLTSDPWPSSPLPDVVERLLLPGGPDDSASGPAGAGAPAPGGPAGGPDALTALADGFGELDKAARSFAEAFQVAMDVR